jgi:uncharacterized repeat protein (TIGR02543 family)
MQSLLRHLRIPSALGCGPWLRCLGLGAALLLSSHCGGGGGGNGSGGPTPQPAQTCTVTFLAETGGSLVGSTSQTIASGASCTAVTAVPDPGYIFTTWTGAGFTSNAASPLTVTNVTQNLTITASFTQQSFTVTFVSGAGGSIVGSTSQTVAYGGSVTAVTAIPNLGYTFTNWTGAGFTTTNASPLTVMNVTQNLTITATFVPQTFTVTFVAGAGGSIAGSTTQTVAFGGSASAVSAVPNAGYTFTNWTGAGFTTTNASPLTVANVTQNLIITSTFTQQTFTVTFVAGAGGSIVGSTSQTVAYGGSAAAVSAVPSAGYTFTNWTGASFTTTNAIPMAVMNVTQNLTITANFTQQTFRVTFAAGPGGSVTGSTTQTVVYGGSASAVSAVPSAGCTFTNWTGAGFTTTNASPLTVMNVTQNLTITANFTQQTFTVTFAAGPGGSITGSTTQTVAYGGSASAVSAVPNAGYTFTNWTGAGFTTTKASPLTVTNVTQNLTITASFAQQTFTVTFVAGAGGSLTGTTTQTVAYGASAMAVSAVPSAGYTFTNWTGAGFTTTNAIPMAVMNVTQNLTITANFTQQTFTVTFAAGPSGSITGSTTQTVAYGGSASAVSAVPSAGCTFTNWTGAGFTTTNASPLTVMNVTQNLNLTATFVPQTFTVTFVAGAGGSITGTTTQTVAFGGSAATVSAVTNTGFNFTNWIGAGFTTTNANPLTVANVTQNLTITATFVPQTLTVTFVAGAGGSISGTSSQTMAYGSSATAVSAVPNAGYTFSNWTGAGFTATNANPLTVTNVTQNLTITANFTQQTFTVAFAAGPGGSITGSTTQTVVYGGSALVVSVVPSVGYTFTNWTGAGFTTTNANPLTVTNVTQNLTITATFVPQTFTVTFVAGAGGSISGSTSQTVAYGGSALVVSAVPSVGYTFTNWTGAGFTTTSASLLAVTNVTQNLIIMATFVPQTFTVTFVAGAGGSISGSTSLTVAYNGSTSAVTAVPNAGSAFVNWTGPGFTTSTSNPLIIANVTADLTITANSAPTYTVSFLTGAAGTLTGSTTQTVTSGGSCSPVTAVPNSAYGFFNWTGTGGFVTTGANPPTVTNVTANLTLTANYQFLPVIGSFWATSTTINAGHSAILNWTGVNHITSGSIDNGGGSFLSPNGIVGLYPAATTTYTLTASNAVGTVTSSVTVTVITKPVISSFTATPSSITVGGSSTLAWTVTGIGVTCILDQGIGAVGGTSLDVTPVATKTYTLTATNAAGSKAATVTVTVSAAPPTGLGYASSPATYTKGVAIAANAPSNGGGAIASYTVGSTLPAGLNLDPSSGIISGTPTALAVSAIYRITGTNSGGSTFVDLSLAVLDAPPVIDYGSGSFTFHVGTTLTPMVPTLTGGAVLTWSIAPALPAGLAFNTGNGTISGTPSAPAANQTYTITATNSGGSSVATPSLQVLPPGPVITLQPHGQILAAGAPASFSVAATGTGTLSFQWSRSGTPISGATTTTYDLGAMAAGDDGAVFTVAVSDAFGTTTTSDAAPLALFQDLATWLAAHPAIAGAIKWQFQAASGAMGVYQAPAETDKKTWATWSAPQQADLNQAYLDVIAWINQGAPQVTMPVGALGQTTLTDRPWNTHASANDPNSSTIETVEPAYMWKLYIAHVAFSLMLETSHQVPWSVTDYPDATLKWIFDSATMAWLNGSSPNMFMVGTYDQNGFPPLRTNNRPRTSFADPRWTYPWLKQAGLIGSARLTTVGNMLDWMRHNLTHFYDAESIGRDLDIWQYNGYSPLSGIVNGTIDAKYPGLGSQHWTAGCHGSTGFLHAALRVLNIPVQPIWVCGHELVYFMSEDKYMDHADDPYNAVVRASGSSSLLLLMDSATWRGRFGNDETVNFLDLSDPVQTWIGYTAAHFP